MDAFHHLPEQHGSTYRYGEMHNPWTENKQQSEQDADRYHQRDDLSFQDRWNLLGVANVGSSGSFMVSQDRKTSSDASIGCEEGRAANVAGFGARKFAQKQQQEHLRKETAMYEAEARRRMAEKELRKGQFEEHQQYRRPWEEDEHINQGSSEEHQEDEEEGMCKQEEEEQAKEWRRMEDHRVWAQEQRLCETYGPEMQSLNVDNAESLHGYHKDGLNKRDGGTSKEEGEAPPHSQSFQEYEDRDVAILSRSHAHVEATAHSHLHSHDDPYDIFYEDYSGKKSYYSTASSVPLLSRDARRTLYGDEYEEPDPGHWDVSEEGTEAGVSRQDEETSTIGARSTLLAKSVTRFTTLEPLPLAKCADCGESIAFEDLIDHECIKKFQLTLIESLTESPNFAESSLEALSDTDTRCKPSKDSTTGMSPLAAGFNPLYPTRRNEPPFHQRPLASSTDSSSERDGHLGTFGEDEKQRRQAMKRYIEAQREAKRKESSIVKTSSPALKVVADHYSRSDGGLYLPNDASPIPALSNAGSGLPRVLSESTTPSHSRQSPESQLTCERHFVPPASYPQPSRTVTMRHRAKKSSISSSSSVSSARLSVLGDCVGQSSNVVTPSSSFDILCEGAGVHSPKDIISAMKLTMPPKQNSSGLVEVPPLASEGEGRHQSIDLTHIESLLQDLQTSVKSQSTKRTNKGLPLQADNSQSLRQRLGEEEKHKQMKEKKQRKKQLGIDAMVATSDIKSSCPRDQRSLPNNAPKMASFLSPTKEQRSGGQSPRRRMGRERSDRASDETERTILCSVCLCKLTVDMPKIEQNGKVFCKDDFADLFLNKCRKCTKPIVERSVKSSDGAIKGNFHVSNIAS